MKCINTVTLNILLKQKVLIPHRGLLMLYIDMELSRLAASDKPLSPNYISY